MDQNWLMAALQSPEGMNFLNMWRQKMGVGNAAGSNPGSYGQAPIAQRPFPSSGTGGPMNRPFPGGVTGGLMIGQPPASLPTSQVSTPTSFRGGLSIGGNDLAGQQQSAASPMMPFWNPGN